MPILRSESIRTPFWANGRVVDSAFCVAPPVTTSVEGLANVSENPLDGRDPDFLQGKVVRLTSFLNTTYIVFGGEDIEDASTSNGLPLEAGRPYYFLIDDSKRYINAISPGGSIIYIQELF